MRINCSSDREKKFWGSLEQFIQAVKDQNNFWQQNAFLTIRAIRIQIGKNHMDLETSRES